MEDHVTFQNLMPVKTLLSFQPRRHPQETCPHPSFSPPVATLVPPKSSLGGQRTSRRSTKARDAGAIRRRGVRRKRKRRSACRRPSLSARLTSRQQTQRWRSRSAGGSSATRRNGGTCFGGRLLCTAVGHGYLR